MALTVPSLKSEMNHDSGPYSDHHKILMGNNIAVASMTCPYTGQIPEKREGLKVSKECLGTLSQLWALDIQLCIKATNAGAWHNKTVQALKQANHNTNKSTGLRLIVKSLSEPWPWLDTKSPTEILVALTVHGLMLHFVMRISGGLVWTSVAG